MCMVKQVQASSISTQGTLEQTPASTLARHAIPLLEAAIKERFGLTVKMGAELEFSVIPSDRLMQQFRRGLQHQSLGDFIDPLKMTTTGGKTHDYRPRKR